MFVSHDKNINKKKFQKPNILRRKSKIPSVKLTITPGSCESPETKSLNSFDKDNESQGLDLQGEKLLKRKHIKPVQTVKKLILKTNTDYSIPYEVQLCDVEENKTEENATTNIQSPGNNTAIDSHEETEDKNTLNVESFLVSDVNGKFQNVTMFENDMFQSKISDVEGGQKWCLELNSDFNNITQKLVLEQCEESQMNEIYLQQKSDFITTMVPLSEVSVHHNSTYILPEEQSEEASMQKISVDQFFSRSHKYKCDVPSCDKEFMSEQKLKKHKNVHTKGGSTRVPRQTVAECPVKKIHDDGTEEPCGMIFQIREELIKHLNEDHKPEDALYRCEECGRRFFWASGLRAHGRAHRSRRPRLALACAWPGCGRVFRQPCRLREHTRAHTGDKPYPCHFPNCGWSFRTASKLVRHARRHTGERRHACAACGRAFLRREHLRDHAARHHHRDSHNHNHNHARHSLHCTHTGCEQIFNNMNSLYNHMKKVHCNEQEDVVDNNVVPVDDPSILKTDSENIFMVTYMPESSDLDAATKVEEESAGVQLTLNATAEGEGEDSADEACAVRGSARTHCTWPLPRARYAHPAPTAPTTAAAAAASVDTDAYVLEEDTQVENSEISENNIYTVRSDLFLHGNVLTNEDSEHMRAGCGAALDAELLLAPSVDIAQEELYTDAVDESAFRVFLLSGEDLT